MDYQLGKRALLSRADVKNIFSFSQKGMPLMVIFALVLTMAAPVIVYPNFAQAAPPEGSTLLFSDDFGTGTGGSSLSNKWNTSSPWDASDGNKDDSQDGFTVGTSGKGLLIEGSGSGDNPDEGAQRDISTHGYASIYIEYSRAWKGNESTNDEFVAEYLLDDGSPVAIETINGSTIDADTAHSLNSITVDNPNRHTKLTLRFYVNSSASDDKVGIDDVKVYGSDAPNFYDGFESGNFTVGDWDDADAAEVRDEDSIDIWTDDNDSSDGYGVELEGESDDDPDQRITKDFDTTDLENIYVRYSRETSISGSNDEFRAEYFVGGDTNDEDDWINLAAPVTVNDSYESVLVGPLPSSANDNPNFKIRFAMFSDDDSDEGYIDDVVIWGSVLVPTTGSIKVTKNTVGGDGSDEFDFTGDAGTFSIETTGGTGTYTINDLTPGVESYSITETSQEEWTETENTCQDLTVVAGETTECMVTNTKKGSIVVYKNVLDPNNQEVSDNQTFTIHKNGGEGESVSEGEGNEVTYSNLVPGTYTITEDGDENYDFVSFSPDADTESPNDAQVVVNAGATTELTITNKQKMAHITVNKTVDNSHGLGTNVAVDFTFQVNGGEATNFETEQEDSLTAQKTINVIPGTYTITETDNLGYAIGYENCTSLVLGSNGSAVCDITNYDLDPTKGAITVIKNLILDNNGNAEVEDFTLNIAPSEGETMEVDSGEVMQLLPDTYTISEIIPESIEESYAQTGIACTDNGDTIDGNVIELEVGHVYECIITNNDNPAQLTIVKNTNNTNYNGTFEFTVTGQENVSIETVSGTGQTTMELDKGSYDVAELVPAGWNPPNVSCLYDGESAGSEITNGEHIYVDNGDEVTCTFTNTRQTGNITVIKVVETTDENITADDFTIHIQQNGEDATEPAPGQGGEGHTYEGLPTGTYTVTETGVEGYSASYSENCLEGTVTVANGETATCTITNTQITDTDEDGQSNDDEIACGSNPNDAESESLDTDSDNIPNCVDTDDDGDEVLDATDNCPVNANTNQADTDEDGIGNVCDSTPEGESVVSAKLTVIKEVINNNGKTKTATSFSLFVGTTSVVTGVQNEFAPGTYNIHETADADYSILLIDGDCAANGDITLAAGDVKTCRIVNDDIGESGGGGGGSAPIPSILGDINKDLKVDALDLAILFANWGNNPANTNADVNKDGKVDIIDFSILMVNWTAF